MDKIYIIKIGGNIIDDEEKLSTFLLQFSALPEKKILVHGGGKLATKLADELGVEQKMIDGRRITDKTTLEIITMVYAGLINKKIVSRLQQNGCNAVGLTGADGNVITAHKRIKAQIDYGFAGDIDSVNTHFIQHLFKEINALVIAPVTHDMKGQLLNTNADTVAQELATALSKHFDVDLVYVFEKAGVLHDANNDETVISHISPAIYEDLKARNLIFAGMIPKLDNAFSALKKGVSKVIIGKADNLELLVQGKSGTEITNSHISA